MLTIATCQHPASGDIEANLGEIRKQIRMAAAQGADIVHFFECNLSGYAGTDIMEIDPEKARTLKRSLDTVRKDAAAYGTWVITGSHCFENSTSKPYNSLYVLNNKGDIVGRYDKRLLTGLQGDEEHKYYTPGEKPLVFSIKGIRCGLLICHEWRYPELYREYYKLKTRVIFQSWYDGNQSYTQYINEGKELGELITGYVRGNAANNHLWISASNTSSRESSFPAFVVRPDGRVLHRLARNRPGILISRIDTEQVFNDPSARNRKKFI
jgi:predicted amidohydrolase